MYCRIIFTLFLALLFQTTWAASPTHTEFVEKTMQKFIRETQAPGAAVAIVRDGKAEISVFGYADLAKKTPVTPKTIFEVGSITKLFTAILLADDVNHHRLQLTDSISQHMPEVEGNWVLRRITLDQLATHTAGFPFQIPESLKTPADLKQYLLEWKPAPSSGLTYQYSNPGIGLLGRILEAENHRDINQLYLERIILPLHMSPIGITVPSNLQSSFAQGYYADGKPAPYTGYGLFPATGALKMSIEDLSKFLSASLGAPGTPKELSQAIKLSTPQVQVGNMQQGLGWQVRPFKESNSLMKDTKAINIKPTHSTLIPREAKKFNPNALIEKTGGANGFRAYIALIPNSRSGVVIVTNRFVDTAPLVSTARTLLFKAN